MGKTLQYLRRVGYLRKADDAEALAAESDDPLTSALCLYMARSWRQMASEVSDMADSQLAVAE